MALISCHSAPACVFLMIFETTPIYPLSLLDALPILLVYTDDGDATAGAVTNEGFAAVSVLVRRAKPSFVDRKSTRLNSSHLGRSYAVFRSKKKYAPPPWRPASHAQTRAILGHHPTHK